MSWTSLPTDYTDAVWEGLKKYNQIDNSDGTVSLQDVTVYTNKEKSFFGAKDANRMNEALNQIMSALENGTDLYEEFQTYFNTQKQLFEDKSYTEYESYETYLAELTNTYKTNMDEYTAEQQTAFEGWLASIKEKLGSDVAGNLQNQIDSLKETSHTHENKSVLDNLSESDGKLTFNAVEVGDVKIDDESTDGTKVTWSAKKINEEFNKFTPKGTPVGTVTNITATAGDSKIYIKWTDPDDVEFPDTGTTIKWGGTKLVYKQGSYPTSVADGILILDSKVRNAYQETAFELTGLTNGVTIYIALFPYTEEGIVTSDVSQCISKTPQAYELYGFKITNDSDPANKIQYLGDAVGYTGAKMNYTTGKFEFGSWENSWFIKKLKPCMLKYDGTVAYELNKNNYAEKADGTASDISNVDYEGNAMIGIPKVYWKMTANSDGTTTVWVSSVDIQKEDKIIYNDTLLYGLKCWAHYDNNGDEIDYCYSPAYNGYKDSNNRLRSLSGKTPTVNTTATDEITYAQNNNPSGENMWQTEVFIDRQLINILLMLIGKSTDTQTVFGKGRTSASSAIDTGTMDNKGLFWGSDDGTSGVKVFGIENYWGNLYRRIAGLMSDGTNYMYKMTYSKKDGSTTVGYNTTGSGYLTSAYLKSSGYISKQKVVNDILLPSEVSGSETTYYCDCYYYNSSTRYAYVGGYWSDGAGAGAFYCNLYYSVSDSYSSLGASLSCKPPA